MDEYQALSHTTWECKYHVVFIPKCRRKTLYLELRRHLGEVFHKLAQQKESKIEEGHLMPDHVHLLISIPPKYAVSQVVGFIKGKSAIRLARVYGEGSATSSGSTSGPEDTSSIRWGATSRRYGPTSATRRRKIRGSINSNSGADAL
jgi:putative transposase